MVLGGFKLFRVVLNGSGVFLDGSGAGSKLFRVVLGGSWSWLWARRGQTTKRQTVFFPPMRWVPKPLHQSAAAPSPPCVASPETLFGSGERRTSAGM